MIRIYKNKIKKISLWEIIIIISPFLVLLIYKLSQIIVPDGICIWKLITGHECWGCNITHAIIAVIKLDLYKAIRINPFVIVVFPILLYSWLKYVYERVKFFLR